MSSLYNELKYNVEKINNILTTQLKTEKFLKSGTWISPLTGTINVYGVGSGQDGDGKWLTGESYYVGQTITVPIGLGFPLVFLGGKGCTPSKRTFDVIKGKIYNVLLAEQNVYNSEQCIFDDKPIGLPLSNIYHCRSYPDTKAFPFYELMTQPVGTVFSFSQIPCKEFPPDMHSGADGTGIAGIGIEGKAEIISANPFVIKLLEITSPAGKGGSGFCEISYPFQTLEINLFNDEYP